ncbi:MarR family winged helix-turn-helix transcriptional regulator [Pontibacter ramchanderi]|uniref:DNA-binding MarR family transcriptional regulator n=1 Tax=Pontibacter ramchanderi TaxID=1179743 RepID=A0A2N3V1B2_9BACT|nr:MarR family transcriptional regulator [Pontibacter ramchanderi]PKV75402.1 DNA-binding MarR family transcriptional regulator [Pontibacter ramchanderi]
MQSQRNVGVFTYRNEWQNASLNIILTNSLLLNSYEEFFKKHDLTGQQYNILRILREHHPKPVSTSVLRNNMLDKMSDTSRLVGRLKTKGLVDVERNISDKRLVNIVISDKGFRLLEKIGNDLYRLDNLLQGLTEEEATTLAGLLAKARESISTAEERLTAALQFNEAV